MFTIAPSRVLDGWWAVLDHNGTVARRPQKCTSRRNPRPAVYRERAEAEALALRLNRRLPKGVIA